MSRKTTVTPAVIGAFVLGTCAAVEALLVLVVALPVTGWMDDMPVPVPAQQVLHLLWETTKSRLLQTAPPDLIAMQGLVTELAWRTEALAGAVIAAAATAFFYLSSTERPVDTARHVSGRRPLEGDAAVEAAARSEANAIARTGQGLWLAPDVAMARERETLQLAVMGAVGGGKTQVFLHLLEQILERNDKLVCHDTKGDYVAGWPDDDFILLAPTDARTWAWDVARDVANIQGARELAARLIPQAPNTQQMWSQGSRAILTGLIVCLQRCKPMDWSWRDLLESTFLPPEELRSELELYYPEAARFISLDAESGEPNLTSYGFVVGAQAPVAELIGSLAAAWCDVPVERRISLVGWMLDDQDRRPIILQRSAEYPALSAMWIGAALDVMAAVAASSRLGESRERRIWLLLDEFAQIDVSRDFTQALLVGRSKGICTVVGLQDPHQISQKFDDDTRKIFASIIGTTVITRVNSGDTAKYVSETLIGQREVEHDDVSVAYTSQGGGKTTTVTKRRETVPVIAAADLEKLGPRQRSRWFGWPKTDIEAVVLGFGDALRLRWPLTIWRQQRPGTVPAAWLAPPPPGKDR